MVIDAHVHLYPPEVAQDPGAWAEGAGERHWAVLCTRRRRDGRPVQSLPTIEALLRAMDQAGISRAVLQGWYWEKPETCAWQNQFYARCVAAHPDRLAACATFHPNAGTDAVRAELHRCRDLGLRGLGELSPHSQGYPMAEPAFQAAVELAAEFRWPVNLHVTDPDTRPYPGRIETPLDDFVQLARDHPAVTFILAHWGALLPIRRAEVVQLKNVYYDTAASPLLYGPDVWQRFLSVVPGDRVLFGSDYPLNLYPRVSIEAEMSGLRVEATAAGVPPEAMGLTAERLFFGESQHRP